MFVYNIVTEIHSVMPFLLQQHFFFFFHLSLLLCLFLLLLIVVLVFTVSNSLDLKRLSLDIVDILMTILPNEVEVGWRCHVSISVTVALFF